MNTIRPDIIIGNAVLAFLIQGNINTISFNRIFEYESVFNKHVDSANCSFISKNDIVDVIGCFPGYFVLDLKSNQQNIVILNKADIYNKFITYYRNLTPDYILEIINLIDIYAII